MACRPAVSLFHGGLWARAARRCTQGSGQGHGDGWLHSRWFIRATQPQPLTTFIHLGQTSIASRSQTFNTTVVGDVLSKSCALLLAFTPTLLSRLLHAYVENGEKNMHTSVLKTTRAGHALQLAHRHK